MKTVRNSDEGIVGPVAQRNTYICFLGPPGAGKTTLAQSMANRFSLPCFSTSGFLREYAQKKPNSREAIEIRNAMMEGRNVADKGISKLIINEIKSMSHSIKLIDGFPRNPIGLKEFKSEITETGHIIFFHVYSDFNTCRERFLSKSKDLTDHKFSSRMSDYTSTEREMLSRNGASNPVLDIRT